MTGPLGKSAVGVTVWATPGREPGQESMTAFANYELWEVRTTDQAIRLHSARQAVPSAVEQSRAWRLP
jgi:hypothetical protein